MDSSVSPKDEIWFLRVCHHISNAVYYITRTSVKKREREKRKGCKQSCSICTEQNEGNFNLAEKQFAIGGPVWYFVIFRLLPQRPTNCPTKGRLKIICRPERRFSLSKTPTAIHSPKITHYINNSTTNRLSVSFVKWAVVRLIQTIYVFQSNTSIII